jgi:hypothetical protein
VVGRNVKGNKIGARISCRLHCLKHGSFRVIWMKFAEDELDFLAGEKLQKEKIIFHKDLSKTGEMGRGMPEEGRS